MQEVVQGTSAAYDVVNVGSSPVSDITYDVIYLTLNIGHGIDVIYDRHLESLFASVGDNG